MNLLINYGKDDEAYKASMAHELRQRSLNAFSTARTCTVSDLVERAKLHNCKAILVSNEETLKELIPGKNPTVDNWRGSRLNYTVPVIIINKFAHLHKVPHGKWLLGKDLDKLNYLYKRATPFSYEKLLRVQDFKEAYNDLSKAMFIYYDIETRTAKEKQILDERGNPVAGAMEVGRTYITCASYTGVFESGELRTYLLPLINFDKVYWDTAEDYFQAHLFLKRVNALPNPKAMHNGMYDATHSIIHNAPPRNYILDTMAFAHAEFAELPKDLSFVASYQLFDYIQWKDDAEAASKSRDQEKYWAYNAKDTWHGARILIQQLRTLPAYAISNYKNKFQLTYPALYANFEGLQIDGAKRIALRKDAETALRTAESKLRIKFADPNFNPGSWQQVQKYIYRYFGAKHPKIGKSKSGTDEKNLLAIAEQHPLLARLTTDILVYRENQKAIGTYIDYLQFKGRLLWALNPFGTETERMACSASSLWCGTQVQNIPAYAKEMLVADTGYYLFEADNKQSEGRTTAYCSQEEALIAALEDAERDFYKTLGTLFFSIPYEEVTDFFRNKVLKRIVHGTNYMMQAKTFIENIGIMILYECAPKIGYKIVDIPTRGADNEITLKGFATLLLDSYHKPFPRVREWYKEVYNEVRDTGYIVSPLGHTRKCFGDITRDHAMFRGLVAHQPQNLSVEILNIGFNRVYNEIVIPSEGAVRLKAQIHDSIFGQVRIDKLNYYAPQITGAMDNPVVVHGRTLRIPVDFKYGKNWGKYDPEKNPDGMRDWQPNLQLT